MSKPPDGIRTLVLSVYGPDDEKPSARWAWQAKNLRKRGRMAQADPGEYLAPVVAFRRPNRRTVTMPVATGDEAA